MLMVSISTDLYSLKGRNCSQMLNWILMELENGVLFFGCWVFLIFVLFFPNKNPFGFYMRYHLFLHYGWFHQNLEKDFISTNMHTIVTAISMGELGM